MVVTYTQTYLVALKHLQALVAATLKLLMTLICDTLANAICWLSSALLNYNIVFLYFHANDCIFMYIYK